MNEGEWRADREKVPTENWEQSNIYDDKVRVDMEPECCGLSPKMPPSCIPTPSPHATICHNCRFFCVVSAPKSLGECRAQSPYFEGWPPVYSYEFCGDFDYKC